jgi:acyl carrier protein
MSTTSNRPVTRNQIHDTLWDLASKVSGKDSSQLGPGSRLVHDLGADSLAMVEFSMEIEERLGVSLPDDMMENPELTLGEVEEAIWTRSN